MDYNEMEQLTDMGFTRELATQALAATGGKSTLKATEWILNQRKNDQNAAARQQARVDHFFSASTSKVHEMVPAAEVEADIPVQKSPANGFRRPSLLKGKEETVLTTRTVVTITDKAVNTTMTEPNLPQKAQKHQIQQAILEEPPAKKQKQDEQQQPTSSFQFLSNKVQRKSSKAMVPLAERMRPTTIEDIVGQEHLLGARGIMRSLLESDSLASVIFWGPPGTGKTTLARAMAATVTYHFVALSAVTSGVKEVREVLEEAKKMKKYGQRTLLFLDEVHRFNKAQQDAFLPYVEAGHVVFIGATTENPSFEINAALLSRCKVLTLNKLQPEHIWKLIERAIADKEKGVVLSAGISELLRVEDDAIHFLASAADGDARVALNTLEIAVLAATARFQKAGETDENAQVPTVKITSERILRREGGGTEGDNRIAAEALPGLRRETSGVEKMIVSTTKRESFNILEVLKENVQHSQQEYTRPFKKFVGGKNVTAASVAVVAGTGAADAEEFATSPKDKDLPPYVGGERKARDDTTVGASEIADVEKFVVVTLGDVKDALQRSHVFYDKTGEEHYNIISALHKSMRGGDADAAIYWLARMLEGGEGPLYVARRLVRFASEDVGLADPQALQQAVACYQACHFLGMPECNVHLAQCVVYLALAPKSVAVYQAIEAAQRLVQERGQNEPVPLHLRNAPTKLMKELGYAKGYIYPPSQNGPVEQEYMPPSLRGHKFLRWSPP